MKEVVIINKNDYDNILCFLDAAEAQLKTLRNSQTKKTAIDYINYAKRCLTEKETNN